MKKLLPLIFLFLLQTDLSAKTFQSSSRHTTLLELYSSEGCSSCPPADDWLRAFRAPASLWRDYVPVVFHVDYWDGMGWKDPFGSAHFTERQQRYVQLWHGSTLFTPCVVINGQIWASWYKMNGLPLLNESTGTLKVDTKGAGQYSVIFEPVDKAVKNYEAHIALLGFDIESHVDKGENAGKILKHDFIVLDYQHGTMTGASPASAALNLNTHDSRARKFGVAAWITQSGNPLPIQATGGYLD